MTLIVIYEHFRIIGFTFKHLQNKTLLVDTQREVWNRLLKELITFHRLEKRSGENDQAQMTTLALNDDENVAEVSEKETLHDVICSLGSWSVSHKKLWDSIPELGLDARELFDTINDKEDSDAEFESLQEDILSRESASKGSIYNVCKDVATVGLITVNYLEKLISDEDNREMPPPTRPLGIASLSASDFQDIVRDTKQRIVSFFGADGPRTACFEQNELRKEISRDGNLKAELEKAASQPTATFKCCWEPLGVKYSVLRKIAAGFATVFPGSSPVESEFSILKQDKRPQRSRMADLTIEGGLHARQWQLLQDLEAAGKRS